MTYMENGTICAKIEIVHNKAAQCKREMTASVCNVHNLPSVSTINQTWQTKKGTK